MGFKKRKQALANLSYKAYKTLEGTVYMKIMYYIPGSLKDNLFSGLSDIHKHRVG